MKWLSIDSPFNRFMGKIADLIILSVLWILFCIPVVTIGPATTGMYFAVLRMNEPDSRPVKDFFRSFKQNFWQAVAAELFAAVFLALVLADAWVLLSTSFGDDTWPWVLWAIILVITAAWISWAFPMLAKFEVTWMQLFKTPVMLSVLHFFSTVLIVLVNLSVFILMFAYPEFFMSVLPIIVFLGPAGLAYINSIQMRKAFRWYIPVEGSDDDDEDDEQEDGAEDEADNEKLPKEEEA